MRLRHVTEFTRLAGFAFKTPGEFSRSVRDAGTLMFDRRFWNSSPIQVVPSSILSQLAAGGITVPPASLLGNGTQSLEGLIFLVSLAKALEARFLFEIGTFTGVTALTLAMNLPDLIVHTLDLPPAAAPQFKIEADDRVFVPSMRRGHVFDGHPEANRIIEHQADSAEFDFGALKEKFDLVYVDGAHSYEYVASDTQAASRISSDRGAIVWDDYQRCWPGVVRYLNERSELQLYRVPSTRLVLWLSEGTRSQLVSHRKD